MITQALRDEIEAGTLLPGTVLKQEELAARFGVSRQPIRHALERLHETGLLENGQTEALPSPDCAAKTSMNSARSEFRLKSPPFSFQRRV